MIRVKHVLIAVLSMLSLAAGGAGLDAPDPSAIAQALKQGGYVLVFRHGATHRDQADTDPLNYDNVARQRLLTAAGKDTARQIGMVFRALKVPVGKVYTSKYHRAVETGQLIGGTEVTASLDVTEGGLVASPNENDRRAAALRAMVTAVPAAGTNTIIVTPSRTSSTPSARTGSRSRKAKYQSSSPTAARPRSSLAACKLETGRQ